MRCFTSLRFVLHDIPLVISSIPLSYRATRGISQYKCFTAFCMTFTLSFQASPCHSEHPLVIPSATRNRSKRCITAFCMTFPLSFRASLCHSECNEESLFQPKQLSIHCQLLINLSYFCTLNRIQNLL